MPRKVVFLFALLTLTACLLSYKFGSAPLALAKGRASAQETSESAASLTLPTAPATWSLTSGLKGSGGALITKPAGGSGVKHVATCVVATLSNNGGSFTPTLTLWDGNTSGTLLLEWALFPYTTGQTSVNVCDLNVVGSANTPMTLDIGAGANQFVSANLVGYDAQ